jgi:hypothetical protein
MSDDTKAHKLSYIKAFYNSLVESMHTQIMMHKPAPEGATVFDNEKLRKLVIEKQLEIFSQMMNLHKKCEEMGVRFPTHETELGELYVSSLFEDEKQTVITFFKEAITLYKEIGHPLTWNVFKKFLEYEFERAKKNKVPDTDALMNKKWYPIALQIINSGVSTWSHVEPDLETIFNSVS